MLSKKKMGTFVSLLLDLTVEAPPLTRRILHGVIEGDAGRLPIGAGV